jgi:hypothetical protein
MCAIRLEEGPVAAGLARSAMAYRFATNWGTMPITGRPR